MEQGQNLAAVMASPFSERDERLMEWVAMHHMAPGGLKERHVRDILKERITACVDFEKVIWPKFQNVVRYCKENNIYLHQ